MAKTALITGVTGQDGSFLAELLLEKGYSVHGVRRSSSLQNLDRIRGVFDPVHSERSSFRLHYGDVTDASNMRRVIDECEPDEVYHLAAQSHVKVSFDEPEYTANVDALSTLRLLDAIRAVGGEKSIRFYQASTSELFGKVQETPQTETTPFYPRSPYAVAKLYAYWSVVNYREAYGVYACNGILFNHESERRGLTFVTRKVSSVVAKINNGSDETLHLGNLDAKRDWGYAPEYVDAMWRMLQRDEPSDYVIATGETHSVRELVEAAFAAVGIEIAWEGAGVDEVGKCKKTGRTLVKVDPWYYRPTEVDLLLGDPSKAQRELGWTSKTKFEELVRIMVESDNRAIAQGQVLR